MAVQFKRFMVFDPQPYDALGGLSDCKASFETWEEARGYALDIQNCSYDAYVFDRATGKQFGLRIERGAKTDLYEVAG